MNIPKFFAWSGPGALAAIYERITIAYFCATMAGVITLALTYEFIRSRKGRVALKVGGMSFLTTLWFWTSFALLLLLSGRCIFLWHFIIEQLSFPTRDFLSPVFKAREEGHALRLCLVVLLPLGFYTLAKLRGRLPTVSRYAYVVAIGSSTAVIVLYWTTNLIRW